MAAQKKTISKLFSYGYGLGEFGFTFFNFLVAYYLMYYLTDVLCLPMLTAAAISKYFPLLQRDLLPAGV